MILNSKSTIFFCHNRPRSKSRFLLSSYNLFLQPLLDVAGLNIRIFATIFIMHVGKSCKPAAFATISKQTDWLGNTIKKWVKCNRRNICCVFRIYVRLVSCSVLRQYRIQKKIKNWNCHCSFNIKSKSIVWLKSFIVTALPSHHFQSTPSCHGRQTDGRQVLLKILLMSWCLFDSAVLPVKCSGAGVVVLFTSAVIQLREDSSWYF